MGRPRLQLQAILESIVPNVYHQPMAGAKVKMTYPCIVYKRDQEDILFAGDKPYRNTKRYLVTVIDPDVDSDIRDKVAALPLVSYVRFYTAENLNHDVFNLYF